MIINLCISTYYQVSHATLRDFVSVSDSVLTPALDDDDDDETDADASPSVTVIVM